MQNQKSRKRTEKWTLSKIFAAIGVALLLLATTYMVYGLVDGQAPGLPLLR